MIHDKMMSSRALASRVKRYHVFPVIHQETVGEHTHRICTLYLELFGVPRAEVLVHMLYHDMGELSTGDMPFYAKRDVPELKSFMDRAEEAGQQRLNISMPELTDEERAQTKLCDLLQMLEFAIIERQMGNQLASAIQDNIMSALDKFQGLPLDVVSSAALRIMLAMPIGRQ